MYMNVNEFGDNKVVDTKKDENESEIKGLI